MARQRLNNSISNTTKKFEKAGDSLEGYYQGSRTVRTTHGDSEVHKFLTSEGPVDCWGCKALDRGLGAIGKQAPGAYVWVEFKGKIRVGTKSPKTFDIDWDPDDCNTTGLSVSASEDRDADEDYDETESDTTDEVTAEPPTAGNAKISAANVDKANKFLQNKRNEKTV